MNAGRRTILIAVVIGGIIGGALADFWYRTRGTAVTGAQGVDMQTLVADVERLKSLVPTQSHAMNDVGRHWANLYIAARAGNWPLARFFFNEARQYARWMVLIRPVRRGPNGQDVDVKAMWEGLEPTTFASVDISIDQADFTEFEKEYRAATESCYACHSAAGLPHIRPQIPTEAATQILNFDPQATWP